MRSSSWHFGGGHGIFNTLMSGACLAGPAQPFSGILIEGPFSSWRLVHGAANSMTRPAEDAHGTAKRK